MRTKKHDIYLWEYRGHPPNFEGKHNLIKSKAWLVMLDRSMAAKEPLTIKELSYETGVDYLSLKTLIPKWVRWNYCWTSYEWPMKVTLLDRGRQWCLRWLTIMPMDRIISEIEEWERIRPPFEVWNC